MRKEMFKRTLAVVLTLVILIGTTVSVMVGTVGAEDKNRELASYNAIEVLTEAQNGVKHLYTDNVFSYSEKNIELDSESGSYLPVGQFNAKTLNMYTGDGGYCSHTGAIRNALTKMLFKWDANTGEGFAVYQNKIVTFAGNQTKHAPALTFTAPEAGTVRLYDPAGGDVSPAKPDNVFWTLDGADESVGFVIYKNNTKIWPEETDYYVLNKTVNSVKFPDISDITVKEGDKLHIMIIPLTNGWGYMSFAAQVDYTAYGEELPSYTAASAVEQAQEAGALPKDSSWIYTARPIAKNSVNGMNEMTGKWSTPELAIGKGDSDAINAYLPKQLLVSGYNTGLSSKNGQIYTYVGTNRSNSTAGALTFVAPYSGKIEFADTKGIGIGSAGKANPFWTMHDKGEKVGIAVYHNDEKIWPADSDYKVLTGDKWEGGVKTAGTTKMDFPDLGTLTVTRGDKIRIALIPLTQGWGYLTLSPRVDYTVVDAIQPEPPAEMPSYSSVDSVAIAQSNQEFRSDSAWIYTVKRTKQDETTGYNLPYTDWFYPDLALGNSDNVGVNETLGKQMNIAGSNAGVAAYNNKVYTFVGSSFGGYAGALTFVAPYSGKVEFTDKNNIGIGTAGKANPFWTMHEKATKVGVAVYKNDEKIWPADSDYFVMTGDKWENGVATYGNTKIALPDIGTLDVTKGDEIKFALIPLTLNWGYFTLAPQAEYISVDAVQPETENLVTYNSVNDITAALNEGTLDNTNWILEGAPCYPDMDGLNVPTYQWQKLSLKEGTRGDAAIQKAVPKWLTANAGGISVHNKAVIMNTGASGADFALSLTFEAPKSGTVDLLDRTGGMFGTAGISNPFWTLNEDTKIAGLAIYKNGEKLWPADSEYFKLQGQWSSELKGNDKTKINQTLFPSLKDIEVAAGDKLRICVIPVKNNWHFIRLSPQVRYKTIDVNSQKPTGVETAKPLESYSAVDSFIDSAKAESMDSSMWKLQAIENIWSEEVGAPVNLGILVNEKLPVMYKPFQMGDTLFSGVWFNVPNTGLAATVKEERIYMNTASSSTNGIPVLPSLSFSVPKTGMIRLHGLETSPGFAAASAGYPYWTLQKTLDPDAGGEISFIIYRNNEKIWPVKDGDKSAINQYQRVTPFADITTQVYAGDTIRIIPAGGSWSFATVSPVVDYIGFNNKVRPSNDNPEWSYGDKSAYDFTWEDFGDFGSDETISDGEKETSNKKIKKIIKRRYRKGGIPTVALVIIIAVSTVVLLSGGFVLFIVIRKKRKAKK